MFSLLCFCFLIDCRLTCVLRSDITGRRYGRAISDQQEKQTKPNSIKGSVCVCVFFTLNRSSTRRHPAHAVSVLILHPRKISSVVTSYDTEIMHRNAFDNEMSWPSTGYDRHNIHASATEIHGMWLWLGGPVSDFEQKCCISPKKKKAAAIDVSWRGGLGHLSFTFQFFMKKKLSRETWMNKLLCTDRMWDGECE